MEKFEPVPIPELKEQLLVGDKWIEMTRENSALFTYRKFEQMNHFRIHLAEKALMMFGVDGNPMAQYMRERGYTEVIRDYPEEFVQRNYLEWELDRMEAELNGKGHEIE